MKTAGNLIVLGSINADHILNLESFPTPGETVTGSHYQVAFGGKGANQAGLRIPQDMAVIGYDDIELARYMTPPLTTIHQPKDELGELAIDVLIHRMAQPALQQQRLQLTPVLTVRGSV